MVKFNYFRFQLCQPPWPMPQKVLNDNNQQQTNTPKKIENLHQFRRKKYRQCYAVQVYMIVYRQKYLVHTYPIKNVWTRLWSNSGQQPNDHRSGQSTDSTYTTMTTGTSSDDYAVNPLSYVPHMYGEPFETKYIYFSIQIQVNISTLYYK